MSAPHEEVNSLYHVPKSTTLPKVNQSYLTLHLNHPPKHNFRPGELIVGAVTLISFKPVANPVVTVKFSGKTKVTVCPTTTNKTTTHKQKLFQFSQLLTQAETTSPLSTTTCFPFTFNFPSHYIAINGKHESLPPTLTCTAVSPTNLSAGAIKYELKATLSSPDNTLECSEDVFFCTPRTIKAKDIETIGKGATNTISYRLAPTLNKARPSKARDSFPWNKTKENIEQKLTFMFTLHHPAKIICGEPFIVKVTLASSTSTPSSSNDEKGAKEKSTEKQILPEFHFHGSLRLEIKTQIKLNDCAESPNAPQESTLNLENKFSDASHSGEPMTLDKPLAFEKMVMTAQGLGPTFKSRSMSRTAEAIIRADIQIMDKVENFYVKASDIEILPSGLDGEMSEKTGADGDDEIKVEKIVESGKEGDLPSYEDLNPGGEGGGQMTMEKHEVSTTVT